MKPILLVVAPYYQQLSDQLIAGASAAIYGVGREAELLTVPGALEIPGAIAIASTSGRYGAYVALGCVIRGDTSHYEIVCNESARGLQELAVQKHLAIGNGILTCENMEQAVLRADPAQGNKGGEAAVAAMRMSEIRQMFGVEA